MKRTCLDRSTKSLDRHCEDLTSLIARLASLSSASDEVDIEHLPHDQQVNKEYYEVDVQDDEQSKHANNN